jgi:DNA-binding MarR family transcriptional regulator
MTAYSGDLDPEQLLQLSDEVSRIAGTLAQLSMGMSVRPSEHEVVEPQEKTEVSPDAVKWLINARRERFRYISHELFADPAWDILLDLFYAEMTHKRVPVSSLCIASGVPATTGLRWIKSMAEQGILLRRPDQFDGRRVYIELAPDMSQALRQYFLNIVETQRKAA